MSFIVSSIGCTYSRVGPLEALNVSPFGRPPDLPIWLYSILESRSGVGVSASDALIGCHSSRMAPRYGEFRQATESGRGVGSVLNPVFASLPGDRAVVENVCGM